MLNGLSLFSGIGGIDVALNPLVKPVAYCEIDTYATGVLFSRMLDGSISTAPVWPDIRTLTAEILPSIDIVYGGFPCQDISCAGAGKGLAGERSGLFFEIVRLLRELRPAFCYLENVPAITTRGGWRVVGELTALGCDCRWGVLSAYDMGAPHIRERFWLLAHANRNRRGEKQIGELRRHDSTEFRNDGVQKSMADAESERFKPQGAESSGLKGPSGTTCRSLAHSERNRLEEPRNRRISTRSASAITNSDWWATEPNVGRVVNGLSNRVDRIKCLGNAVVPQCAKEALERLIGL